MHEWQRSRPGPKEIELVAMSFRLILLAALCTSSIDAATPCESLAALTLPNTTIALAESVPAGTFTITNALSPRSIPPLKDLPAFCRVAAHIKPSDDSDIAFEVWMPASEWNGKFQGVGNGGWVGEVSYGSLAQALRRGYAAASTDTGHQGDGGDASFALGHPEKVIDFGYRAVHETTVKAKAIVAAFYGDGPRLSYWNGCSSGGKQGLKEAQRFPRDYDGIVAGAPANFWTHLMAADLAVGVATLKDPNSYIPKEKYALLHTAVLQACDALDGVNDGVLEDPTRCHFDPKVLECKDTEGPDCLTAPQVEAARKIYGGAVNPRTGKLIFPGLALGSELGWGALAGGPKPFPIVESHFKYLVFKDPKWDFRTLNLDTDVALADKLDDGIINATDPNLKDFVGHGGKLLLHHGWNDQLIAPQNTIDYYNSVLSWLGSGKAANSVRLFMTPGMNHCGGGDGPNAFDAIGALDQWVEKGKAPDRIVVSHSTSGKVDRTRPLCPFPQTAKYTGTGSTDDAANFVCSDVRPYR
jgi:feruloyl esterase